MLITLEDAKAMLGITSSENDSLIESLIEEAQIVVETYIWRAIESGEITDILDGSGEQIINLPNFPVSTLTSIEYNSGTLSSPSWTSFDADGYSLKGSTGQIRFTNPIPKGFSNIKVVYEAGYAEGEVPWDIILALKRIVSFYWNTRDSGGISSESVDGSSVSFDSTKKPDLSLLDPYRSINV